MSSVAVSSPHGARVNRVDQVMIQVLIALVPGIIAMIWYFGWGLVINIALAVGFALAAEAAILRARGRPVGVTLRDYSAVVTAVLFAISVPPTLPWWLSLLGMLFAIVLVKQLYGGLGYNPFNPAMAAYVFLLVSYPVQMTNWLPPYMLAEHHPGLLDSLRMIIAGLPPDGLTWDAVSAATPLDEMRTHLAQNEMIEEIRQSPLWGDFGGRGWEWVGNWFLVGGIYLLWKRVITWHIPVSMIAALLALSGMAWMFDPQAFPFPAFHLFSGAAVIGAFFIATDPVSACTTRRGQLVYGALIGALVFVIRSWGGYPDAVAFAVLLLNIAAPTIDYYTQPRVFGHGRG
jgi:electron transport complex protein RnfD